MDQVEGFKMYLSTAEKDRLEMLHPPEKTPELFEKYLPYAFALDVENEWSEQFSEVLAQAAVAGQTYSPSWYAGSSWNSQKFSGFAAGLGSSLVEFHCLGGDAPKLQFRQRRGRLLGRRRWRWRRQRLVIKKLSAFSDQLKKVCVYYF